MMPAIKSLLIGALIGAAVTALAFINWPGKEQPPLDLRPYEDSIKSLAREKKLAEMRSTYHLRRADSLERLLHVNHKKRSHDIEVIEAFTPDLRRHWLDSVVKSAGLDE